MPKHMTQLPVAENVRRVLSDIAKRMGGGQLRVGFLEGATYKDETPVAAVAYWDEFGHGGNFPAPPRSFFRTMISAKQAGWGPRVAILAKENNFDGLKVLKIMGEEIEGDLKRSIIDTNSPELSPTTIILRNRFRSNPEDITITDVLKAQKFAAGKRGSAVVSKYEGSSLAKPLVWTGHMLDSTGWEVRR